MSFWQFGGPTTFRGIAPIYLSIWLSAILAVVCFIVAWPPWLVLLIAPFVIARATQMRVELHDDIAIIQNFWGRHELHFDEITHTDERFLFLNTFVPVIHTATRNFTATGCAQSMFRRGTKRFAYRIAKEIDPEGIVAPANPFDRWPGP